MPLGGGSEAGAGAEVETVIELRGDADVVGAEWDEDSVWLGLKGGLDEIDVGVAVAAAVAAAAAVFAVVILADVEAGAGRWKGSGTGEVGGAGG